MATTLDLSIDAGGEFTEYITWYDETAARVDLSAYTAKLTINDAGDGTPLLTIDTSGTDSRIDLEMDSTQNDDYGEVAPDTTGVITLHIYASDTATLSGLSGVYDLILTPGSGTDHNIKLTRGSVVIDTLVTV
jgi:hypothetical protein